MTAPKPWRTEAIATPKPWRRRAASLTALFVASTLAAVGAGTQDPIERIREGEIKQDLFTLAGDAMRGREGGTLDEMTASVWVAERARDAGLLPAGDNGTYFQFFPLERLRVSASSTVTLGGTSLRMGRDVIADTPVVATVDAPIVIVAAESLPASPAPAQAPAAAAPAPSAPAALPDVKGKVVVVRYRTPAGQGNALRTWIRGIQRVMAPAAPAAVVALVPEAAAEQWARVAATFPRGTYALDPDGTAEPRVAPRAMPVLYVREAALGTPLAADARLTAAISADTFTYPSVNVIAKAPGRDPALASEYVLFSAHQDHDGERYPVNGDAIWNGADDNATTAVALLAIGRALSAAPARRSGLFIWHGSEERGLMGSRWYVKHPTVPLRSVVAVLNGDMMGRNDPTQAALLGALPPHRNSPELVQMAMAANTAVSGFTVDSSWDDPQHREGWYYRSDHLPYARAGVPALFFTTLLHADYHTPFDNPDRIDVAKLTRMTRWMYATGRAVADADRAPALDPAFKLERCTDFTGRYC
ncbi:MAG: M28 family peptidase [Vicinamibacterales bacterium]